MSWGIFVCVPNQVNWIDDPITLHYKFISIPFSFFGMSAGHHHPSQQIVLNLSWVAFKQIIDCDVKSLATWLAQRQTEDVQARPFIHSTLRWLDFYLLLLHFMSLSHVSMVKNFKVLEHFFFSFAALSKYPCR